MIDIGFAVKAFGGLATAAGALGILLLAIGGPLPPEQIMSIALGIMTLLLVVAGADLVLREPAT